MFGKREYFEPLEGLRGIAAILVALIHLQIFQNAITASQIVSKAGLAVDLFFVISGFVIGHNYLNSLNTWFDRFNFMKRRFWRLYPLHFIILCIYIFFELLRLFVWLRSPDFMIEAPIDKISFATIVSHLFLVQVFTGHIHFYNIPSWSISIEFYCYITFALIGALSFLRKTVVGIIIISCLLIFLFKDGTPLDSAGYINFCLRGILGFYIGVLVAIIRSCRSNKHKFSSFPVMFAYSAIWLGIFYLGQSNFEIFLPFVFGAAIFVISLGQPSGMLFKILSADILQYLGKISYSVYMIHSILWSLLGNLLKVFFPEYSSVKEGLRYFFVGSDYLSLAATFGFLLILILTAHLCYIYVENEFRIQSK